MFIGLRDRRDLDHRRPDLLPRRFARPDRRAAEPREVLLNGDQRHEQPGAPEPPPPPPAERGAQTMAHGVAQARSLFDRRDPASWPSAGRSASSTPGAAQEPGDVRRPGGHGHHLHRGHRPPELLRLGHHGLAVPHRHLRQLRRGHGRGPGQGPGRHAAAHAVGDRGPAPERRRHRGAGCRPSSWPRATCVVCEAGDLIPSDGEIVEGIASVDESAITGESAPVIRESGGDRSAVTGGTKVLSDRIVVRITAERGHTFLDRMIGLVEGANRQKTPNEIALTILLGRPDHRVPAGGGRRSSPSGTTPTSSAGATASCRSSSWSSLLVCLIPTTIGALLSAIGIAGMDRLVQRNVLAMSGRAVEAAGDVQTLLLDKTGTITLGNRMASQFIPVVGPQRAGGGRGGPAGLAGRRDRPRAARSSCWPRSASASASATLGASREFVPFTATTRMSGVNFDGRQNPQGRGRGRRNAGPPRGRHHPGRPGPDRRADRPGRFDAPRGGRRAATSSASSN